MSDCKKTATSQCSVGLLYSQDLVFLMQSSLKDRYAINQQSGGPAKHFSAAVSELHRLGKQKWASISHVSEGIGKQSTTPQIIH